MTDFTVDLTVDGKDFSIPVTADTEEAAFGIVRQLASTPEGVKQIVAAGSANDSLVQKAGDLLAQPEQLATKGLGSIQRGIETIAPEVPVTGNLPADLAMNTPGILLRSAAETAKKVAPGFVSPAAIVTSGALKGAGLAANTGVGKKVLGAAGDLASSVARSAEKFSGLSRKNKGILTEAFKDPSLILAKGKDKAAKLFEKVIDNSRLRESVGFGKLITKKQLVNRALKAAIAGDLRPEEALSARKELDAIKKTIPNDSFRIIRGVFDEIAKTLTKEADIAFSRGAKAEALRELVGVNRSGEPALFKTGLASIISPVLAAAISPAVQGTAASGVGAATKLLQLAAQNPLTSGALVSGVPRAVSAVAPLLRAARGRKRKGKK